MLACSAQTPNFNLFGAPSDKNWLNDERVIKLTSEWSTIPSWGSKILHGWSEKTSGDYLTSRGMWHDQRFMGWQTCNSLAKWCPAGLKYPTCSVHDFMSAWSLSYAAVASLIYHTFVGQKYKCKMCQGKGTFKTVIGFNNIKSSTVDNE